MEILYYEGAHQKVGKDTPVLPQKELNILKTKNLPRYWSCPERFESGPLPRKPLPKLASDLEANILY